MNASLGGGGVVAELCLTLGTPWTVACQAPLSMGFSRQEYWSGLPFPSPGGLPNPGIEPWSPAFQADSFPTELQGKCFSNLVKFCMTQPLNPVAFYLLWSPPASGVFDEEMVGLAINQK